LGERSAVKVAGHLSYCIDRNDNSVIDTSYDANGDCEIQTNEMYTWGEDECVLLWPDLTDSSGRGPRAVAVDLNGYVWVGLHNDQEYVKLDPDTGAEIIRLNVNGNPYGAVIDGNGRLWSANRGGNTISTIDTNTDTIIEPGLFINQGNLYGISVDTNNRLWIGLGWGTPGHGLLQINANNPSEQTYHDFGSTTRGVTVDNDGNIWAADSGTDRIYKWVPDSDTYPSTGSVECDVYLGGNPIGVVTDSQGFIWTMTQSTDSAHKIDPADCSLITSIPVGDGPYTYSDATGSLLAQFIQLGTWTVTISSSDLFYWKNLTWDEWDNPEGNILVEKRTLEESSFTQITSGESFENISTGFVIRVTLTRNTDGTSPKLDNLFVSAEGPIVCLDDGEIYMRDRTVSFNYSSYPGYSYYLTDMIASMLNLPCGIDDLIFTMESATNFNIPGPDVNHNITIVPLDWANPASETLTVDAYCEGPACYEAWNETRHQEKYHY